MTRNVIDFSRLADIETRIFDDIFNQLEQMGKGEWEMRSFLRILR